MCVVGCESTIYSTPSHFNVAYVSQRKQIILFGHGNQNRIVQHTTQHTAHGIEYKRKSRSNTSHWVRCHHNDQSSKGSLRIKINIMISLVTIGQWNLHNCFQHTMAKFIGLTHQTGPHQCFILQLIFFLSFCIRLKVQVRLLFGGLREREREICVNKVSSFVRKSGQRCPSDDDGLFCRWIIYLFCAIFFL